MGMYNPTNTRCRMMSYADVGAPQYLYGDRQSFYNFLDTVLLTGYNTRSVISVDVETVEDKQVITLHYDEEHGYIVGHLLKVEGADEASLNGLWRVYQTVSSHQVSFYNLDSSVVLPEAITGNIITKVAPLDWESVYSTPNQRSFRSKMSNSSRNVITFKYPRHKLHKNSNSPVVHELFISRDIDLSNGLPLDCYSQVYDHVNQTTNDGNPYSPFYYHQHSASISNVSSTVTAGNTTRVPWYVIGDGRIFYIISNNGDTSNPQEDSSYINYNRSNQTYTYRYSYMFGDPDAFDENDIYQGTGTLFSSSMHSPSLNGYYSKFNVNKIYDNNCPIFFVKSYDGSVTMQTCLLTSVSGSSTQNMSGFLSQTYPSSVTGGFIFFPLFCVTTSGGNNITRAKLPYLTYTPLAADNQFANNQMTQLDFKPTVNDDYTISVIVVTQTTSYTIPGSYSFNVGL